MTRLQWVGASVAAVLGLGLAILLYGRFGEGGTRAAVRTFDITSDTNVTIEFSVTKDQAASVVCTLRARDRDGTEVGVALVRVGPSPNGSVTVSHDLPTTARATTGEVVGCDRAPAAP